MRTLYAVKSVSVYDIDDMLQLCICVSLYFCNCACSIFVLVVLIFNNVNLRQLKHIAIFIS